MRCRPPPLSVGSGQGKIILASSGPISIPGIAMFPGSIMSTAPAFPHELGFLVNSETGHSEELQPNLRHAFMMKTHNTNSHST
jgi:hypothetical protein